MTKPTRQRVEQDLRAYLATHAEEDLARGEAAGLPVASKAAWLLKHLDAFTRPARRRRRTA